MMLVALYFFCLVTGEKVKTDLLRLPEIPGGLWEADYINELFPQTHYRHLFESSVSSFRPPGVVLCQHMHHVQFVQEHILKNLNTRKTRNTSWPSLGVLMHISDESMGIHNHMNCNPLYPAFKLVIREFGYLLPAPNNLVQLPLGYMKSFLAIAPNITHTIVRHDGAVGCNKLLATARAPKSSVEFAVNSLLQSAANRTNKWSFIGNVKSDRKLATTVFSEWQPFTMTHSMKASKMHQVYRDSQFVIVGRGHTLLDCFRAYEATIAGAIPIIVGCSAEINTTLFYNGDIPPFVYAPSWPKALDICRDMVLTNIESTRQRIVGWYVRKLAEIEHKIAVAVGRTDLPTVANDMLSLMRCVFPENVVKGRLTFNGSELNVSSITEC